MRAVSLLLVAATLIGIAACDQAPFAELKQKTYANCSSMTSARVSSWLNDGTDAPRVLTTKWGANDTDATLCAAPCRAQALKVCTPESSNEYVAVLINDGVKYTFEHVSKPKYQPSKVEGEPSILFTMFSTDREDNAGIKTMLTEVRCVPSSDPKLQGITYAKINGTKIHVIAYEQWACATFPYTNTSMPPGGVAALLVVIICCLLQFGACAWYQHSESKKGNHNPLGDDYARVE